MGKILLFCVDEGKIYNKITVERTLKQIKTLFGGQSPIIVSQYRRIRDYAKQSVSPHDCHDFFKALLSLKIMWGDSWTIVLRGDIVYKNDTLADIIKHRKSPLNIIKNGDEIIAMTFSDKELLERTIYG